VRLGVLAGGDAVQPGSVCHTSIEHEARPDASGEAEGVAVVQGIYDLDVGEREVLDRAVAGFQVDCSKFAAPGIVVGAAADERVVAEGDAGIVLELVTDMYRSWTTLYVIW